MHAMHASRLFGASLLGFLAVSATSVGGLAVPVWAQSSPSHALHAHARAAVRGRVEDRLAVVLAHALAHALAKQGRDVRIVAMRALTVGGVHGYLVTYLRGNVEGHLFVNARSGKVRAYGRSVRVRVRAQTSTPSSGTSTGSFSTSSTTATSVTLPAFLTALENTLAAEQGAPVNATVEDNGSVLVFTLSIGGQNVTVSVDTNGASATTPTVASLTPPAESMANAETVALTDVNELNIATLASPYVTGAVLSGWDGFGPGNTPVYDVSVASAAGGTARLVVSGTDGTLLGIDTMGGMAMPPFPPMPPMGESNGSAAAPVVTASAALSTAESADTAGVPVGEMLRSQDQGGVWLVALANADGSVTVVDVDATSGSVLGTQSGGGAGIGGWFGFGPGWGTHGDGNGDNGDNGDNNGPSWGGGDGSQGGDN